MAATGQISCIAIKAIHESRYLRQTRQILPVCWLVTPYQVQTTPSRKSVNINACELYKRFTGIFKSKRRDSNTRPLRPEEFKMAFNYHYL